MHEVLARIAVDERDERLRRSADAWRHLHPLTEAPGALPMDLARPSRWRSLSAAWSRWRDARPSRHRPVHLSPGMRASITRG